MTSFRIRPRFRKEVALSPEQIRAAFRHKLSQEDTGCTVTFFTHHILLKVAPEAQHYWSPQLDLSMEETENGTLIRGLYGPKPAVWTLFTFAYMVLGIFATFALMVGFSRWSLGLDAPILWLMPVFAGLAFLLYLGSQLGQKLGAAQLFLLHHLFEEIIRERVGIG
ncbi:MAG: hypothetical protein OHK0053_35740 [Microscillaceae bacterium]